MRRASSSLLPPSFIAASANDSFSAGAVVPVRRGLEAGFAAGVAGTLAGAAPPLEVEGETGFPSSFAFGGGTVGDMPPALESFMVSIGTSLLGMRPPPRGTYLRGRPSLRANDDYVKRPAAQIATHSSPIQIARL